MNYKKVFYTFEDLKERKYLSRKKGENKRNNFIFPKKKELVMNFFYF